MDNIREMLKNDIKEKIATNKMIEAKKLISEYELIYNTDIYVNIFKAIILIMQNELNEAKTILVHSLKIDPLNFDINYNLGYIYAQINEVDSAFIHYKKALEVCIDLNLKNDLINLLKDIEPNYKESNRLKFAFFVKEGLDSFLTAIIKELSNEYETEKIIVKNYTQIDVAMEWSDICWFEWCDELIAYGSNLNMAKTKKIICRLHSYEAFTDYPTKVAFENVDKIIFVAESIKNFVADKFNLANDKVIVIPNGIDFNKWAFSGRKQGFNIAYVGYINYKKGPMLLLHTFKAIYDMDNRYKLYIAGQFQDERDVLYFNQMIKEFGLENNLIFEGWQDNLDKWLENKNYILCTSILESQNMSIMQAMAKGIKPIIHNFVGAKNIYPKDLVWNAIGEATYLIADEKYESQEYHDFVKYGFDFNDEMEKIKLLFVKLNEITFDGTKNINFYLNDVKNKFQLKTKFDSITNLTMLIPTFNRADTLKNDLERGFKLGEQKKIIIDDYSNTINRNVLEELKENKNFGIEDVIFHEENKGVAVTCKTAINLVKTKYTIFSGDDDAIFSYDNKLFKNNLSLFSSGYSLIAPRYIINLNKDTLSLGYDRIHFNNLECKELLKNIFLTGEMYAFQAGAIYKTNDLLTSLPEDIFRNSEDYIMLTRALSNNLSSKIKITENYLYVRRMSINSLSAKVNVEKLTLNILSMIVSGYYCLKNNLVTTDEMINAIKQRGELLQKIYGYGSQFSNIIIMYLTNKLKLVELINIINKNAIIINLSINNLPPEFIKIKKLIK